MTRNELTEQLLGREINIRFVSIAEAIDQHDQSIGRVGGAAGARDLTLLESALHKPMQQCLYDETTDLIDLAACLADGIVQNHAFLDGNKRTAFLCTVLFFKKNGITFEPDAAEAVEWYRQLAHHEVDAFALADWFRQTLAQAQSIDCSNSL